MPHYHEKLLKLNWNHYVMFVQKEQHIKKQKTKTSYHHLYFFGFDQMP